MLEILKDLDSDGAIDLYYMDDWIENAAYENWRTLKKHVEKVLTGFGKEFAINFA